jgi:hypothetical protein
MMVLLAALLSFAGPAGAHASVPTRTCAQRIEAGDDPLGFPVPGDGRILAGPLALSGLFPKTPSGLGPRQPNGRFWVKAVAFVKAGRPVVLSVPPASRGRLFTRYARRGNGEPAVRLEPCPPSTRAFSYDGPVGTVTAFSGGFDVTRPGCYRLDIAVDGGRTYRLRLSLGRPCR